MNRLDRVTHCTEALEVEDEENRKWNRKKSKYCCELCERSVNNRYDLYTHLGSDTLLCERCTLMQLGEDVNN